MATERLESESEDEVERYYAGIGEMKVAHNPHQLIIMGLGSCIGLALYDRPAKVGGIAHIMLPEGKDGSNTGKCCKFADIAVPVLVKEMLRHKTAKERIVAKMAGGASMFSAMDSLQIGDRNAIVVKEELKKAGIMLAGEDTGGNYGRTVTLDTCTGVFSVKTKDGIKSI
ncbi:Chemoreceptor glutamine deamidase CheD [subsurface metagenome]|nr:chemotaxis protein CheD [Methanosarcinales archaeon]